MMKLSTSYNWLAVATFLTAFLFSNALSQLQVGARFPQGVQLGGDVECVDSSDDGRLRFTGSGIEYCLGGQWMGIGNASGVVEDLCTQHGRILEVALRLAELCNMHGTFNTHTKQCDCHCSPELGCWSARSLCSACADEWFGEYCELNGVDECALGVHDCSEFATCYNIANGTYTCSCNEGYEGDGNTCTSLAGSSSEFPAMSCQHALEARNGVADDGPYWIKPSTWTLDPIQIYCRMNVNGGGWNLIAKLGNSAPPTWNTHYQGGKNSEFLQDETIDPAIVAYVPQEFMRALYFRAPFDTSLTSGSYWFHTAAPLSGRDLNYFFRYGGGYIWYGSIPSSTSWFGKTAWTDPWHGPQTPTSTGSTSGWAPYSHSIFQPHAMHEEDSSPYGLWFNSGEFLPAEYHTGYMWVQG